MGLFYLHINIYVGALFRDVVVVKEDAATCYYATFQRVGDVYRAAADEPHIAINTAVVGEVELSLLLSWRIGLVIAVVGLDGDKAAVACVDA